MRLEQWEERRRVRRGKGKKAYKFAVGDETRQRDLKGMSCSMKFVVCGL